MARTYWPHKVVTTVLDTATNAKILQSLIAIPGDVAIQAGVVKAESFDDADDPAKLVIVAATSTGAEQELDDHPTELLAIAFDREQLLMWAHGLARKLSRIVGDARSRELIEAVCQQEAFDESGELPS